MVSLTIVGMWLFLEAHIAQPGRDADLRQQRLEPGKTVIRESHGLEHGVDLAPHRRGVVGQHHRQRHAHGLPVGHVVQRAQRHGQGVTQARFGIHGAGHGHGGADLHLLAQVEILAVLAGRRDVAAEQLDGPQGEELRWPVPAFFEMYDSVACTNASAPLKAVTLGGMVRVIRGSVRATVGQILWLMTRNLVWRSVVDQHHAVRDLAAGARGGGHGDHLDRRHARHLVEAGVVPDVAAERTDDGQALGHIEHAAAAHRHDGVERSSGPVRRRCCRTDPTVGS